MDKILANMSPMAREWLVDVLNEASMRSDNTYVDPEYQEVQDQVGVALWELSVEVEMYIRAEENV